MFETESAAVILWEKACCYIEEHLSKTVYEQWFEVVLPLAIEEDALILGVSDDFFAHWLTGNYGDILDEALLDASGKKYKVKFEFGYQPSDRNDPENEEGELCREDIPVNPELCRAVLKNVSSARHSAAPNCHSRYTFKNFVVGEENRYAYSAATTAAQSPGVFNPLYIYGGTGMGKTHLIQAVANDVLQRNPEAVVRYTTCEGFLNAYSDSLRNKTHFEFRDTYRRVDLLLVDDVHQLCGKEALQEEFFNTFNALHNAGKQIILTSDKQPSEIPGLEARLVSRFESGVTTQITAPTFETRLAILRQKQENHKIKLNDEILSFIATRICSSIRPLEGALLRLTAFSSAMGDVPVTLSTAEALLSDLLDKEAENRKVSVDSIQRTVAEYFGLKVHDIIGNKRPKNIAEPRMMAMYLSRKLTNHSLPEIGTMFGGRNHATVIHAVKQVEQWTQSDEELKRTLSTLKRQLQH